MALGSNNAQQRAREIHQKAWESLPWYANGTLEGTELELVENHVSICVTCRSELKFLQGLGLQIHSSDALDTSAQRGLSEIMSRIAEQQSDVSLAPRSQQPLRSLAGRIANQLRISPSALPKLLAAQAALIVLLVGLIVVRYRSDPGATFHTLSDPSPISQSLSTEIRLLFVDQATERQVRELLQKHRAQIIGGPSPLGVYTVALDPALALEDTDKVLDQIRSKAIVRFADRSTHQAVGGETE
jgi:hypothetical protein